MTIPDGFEQRSDDAGEAVIVSALAGFAPDTWWQRGTDLTAASGRGAVRRLCINGVDVVLRDYRRGGALRGVLPDRFLSSRRVFSELEVTAALRARGVPTVEPLAALARRRGLGFELRLATRLIDDAQTLPRFIATHPHLRRAAVRRAGETVGAAFRAGLHHRDLHPDNLIARANAKNVENSATHAVDVFLLDFDRARLVPSVDVALRNRMLVRMARYLRRHASSLGIVPARTDHLRFLAGLGLDRASRRAAWPMLDAGLRRALRLRNLDARA